MHLYFAEIKDGHWKITTAFPYNSEEYSIHNPTINESGTLLYFSSDMKGGLGERIFTNPKIKMVSGPSL